MNKIALSLFILVLLLLVVPAGAINITMANPGGLAERDIIVYTAAGTLVGIYNATSNIQLDDESTDYIFTMKPLSTNPLEDPSDWLDTSFTFVESNVIPILIILFFLGIFFARWK